MSNFVTLTQEQFENHLPRNFYVVEVPNCKEVVYQTPSNSDKVDVRVYSTIDIRTGVTRRIGSDAIRVVFWDKVNNRPIGKGKKILRVEGATSIGERLKSRIDEFYNQAHILEIIDIDIPYVKAILSHDAVNWSEFATSLLEQVEERNTLSDKQLAWVLGEKNPKGRNTFEATVLKHDPYFKDEWVDRSAEEEILTEAEEEILTEEEERRSIEEMRDIINEPVVNESNDIKLVSTKKYKPFKYSFPKFNPVQSEVLPYANEDGNLIIGANTSAGKTVCAELLMDATLSKGKRVIYLSPLKALTQEKYEDWKIRFADYNISILTGDYTLSEKRMKELSNAHIIVMTSEMCDSRTRRMKSEKNYWLKQTGLVVVDESHILTTDRGHAVETGIMRFTSINKKARILFLSATMPNCNELATWLEQLNGKATRVVFSTWRPVELNYNFVEYTPAYYGSGQEDYWATQAVKINSSIAIAMSKPKEKFLIFVHDKGSGRRLVKRLQEEGENAHFHSADLELADRLEVEGKFSDRENGIRILVSTSTLAWGRNLPARNVIIVGIHRGINEVDELDIIQMAGRAGRYGIDEEGFVYLLIPPYETSTWRDKFANPRPVLSVLDNFMPFHVIAEIETKTIQDSLSLLQWYGRSLASLQAGENSMSKEQGEHLLNSYSEMEMIEGDGLRISPTGLGRVCAWLYFHPSDVYAWYKNFDKVFNVDKTNDALLAWAVGDVPMNALPYEQKQIYNEVSDFVSTMTNDFDIRPSINSVRGAIALHYSLTGKEKVPDVLKGLQRQLIWDIQRINQALKLIDTQYALWESEIWETLPLRFKYGVSEEIVPLTKIKMVGGKRAIALYNKGFTTIGIIAKAKLKDLCKVLTPSIAKTIKKNAKAVLS